jgi:hypothetical protein
MLSIAGGESDRGDAVLLRPPSVGAQYGWKRSQYKRYFTALCTGYNYTRRRVEADYSTLTAICTLPLLGALVTNEISAAS